MVMVQAVIFSTITHKSLTDAKRRTPPNLNEMMAFFIFINCLKLFLSQHHKSKHHIINPNNINAIR